MKTPRAPKKPIEPKKPIKSFKNNAYIGKFNIGTNQNYTIQQLELKFRALRNDLNINSVNFSFETIVPDHNNYNYQGESSINVFVYSLAEADNINYDSQYEKYEKDYNAFKKADKEYKKKLKDYLLEKDQFLIEKHKKEIANLEAKIHESK